MNEEGQEVFAHEVGDLTEGIDTREDFRQELYRMVEAGGLTSDQADSIHQEVLGGNFQNVPEYLRPKAAELFSVPEEETPEEQA
jgi:hypothetical protein